jgi:ribose transport system permease protein
MIVVAAIGAFVLSRTYFGRCVHVMGGNEEAACLAGVNVKRMKLIVFAICGFASGITSVLLFSKVFSGQVSTGPGIEFDRLTAAILDGVSFIGGEGSV